MAAAEAADLFTPREVVVGSLVVAIVAIASFVLPRNAAGVVLACAIVGRAIAGAVGSVSPAGAILDCSVAVGAALTVLWIRNMRLAAATTASCPLNHRPVAVTWNSADRAPLPTAPDAHPVIVPQPLCSLLSSREVQVTDLALRGLTARQVGEHLHLGERTVETYMARVYAKCGVASKAELAELILERATKA